MPPLHVRIEEFPASVPPQVQAETVYTHQVTVGGCAIIKKNQVGWSLGFDECAAVVAVDTDSDDAMLCHLDKYQQQGCSPQHLGESVTYTTYPQLNWADMWDKFIAGRSKEHVEVWVYGKLKPFKAGGKSLKATLPETHWHDFRNQAPLPNEVMIDMVNLSQSKGLTVYAK